MISNNVKAMARREQLHVGAQAARTTLGQADEAESYRPATLRWGLRRDGGVRCTPRVDTLRRAKSARCGSLLHRRRRQLLADRHHR